MSESQKPIGPSSSGSGAKVVDIRAQVEARTQQEAEDLAKAFPEKERHGGKGGPDDPDWIWTCLQANELGDGILFSAINRGRFLFDASAGEWLVWNGNFFDRDITNQASYAVEEVVVRYLGEAQAIGRKMSASSDEEEIARLQQRQSRILKRVDRLRSVRGRQNCLSFATTCGHGSLVVTGERLDSNPWLLPCRNGVIDLRTGRLRPGEPDDLMTKGANVDFPKDCDEYLVNGTNSPCPTWEAFILEIMAGDQAKADYLARLFGYGITGLTQEHVFAVLFGHGRNGKGTLTETLQHVLGPLAAPVPAELLLDQGKVSNPAGPSPHLMALRGLRLAFCSETDQGRRFSAARVKWLSGGDSLVGRHPHDRAPTTFPPSHLLCLGTNHKPRADSSDFAFWSRLHLVEFGLSYVDRPSAPHERPIDKNLSEKLSKERSGILAWLVRGCILWQNGGLQPPPSVLSATSEYRRSEDDLAEWIEDKCIEADGAIITAKAAYQSFRDWWTENISDKPPSQKRFGDAMSRRGYQKDRGAAGGARRYLGLELRSLT